jgi:hypothetical protein
MGSPKTGRAQRKLRNFLIYPQFQLLLIGLNLAIIGATFLLFWVTAHNLIGNLAPVGALSGIRYQFYKDYLTYQAGIFNQMFLISLGLALLLSSTITLVVSHRLAGPFIRMKGFFTAINRGGTPVPNLAFRDGDFFQDLPPIINEAIQTIADNHTENQTVRDVRRA